jgi:hypothetical protein
VLAYFAGADGDTRLNRALAGLDAVRSPFQAASSELIAKLIKAGYLQPALRHDANAIRHSPLRRLRRNGPKSN